MAVRRTVAINVYIEQDAAGMWSSEDDITIVRGATGSDELTWTDGNPVVDSPALADLDVKFWADSVGGTEIDSNHASWDVGDQNLGQIITVSNLQTVSGGFTVDLNVDSSGITMSELQAAGLWDNTNDRLGVIVSVEVVQPDP